MLIRGLFVALLTLILASPALATTYWVSTTGGETVCANVDGDADPGVYMTLAQMDTSNCATSGDTVMFKAGTYTGTHKYMDTLFVSPSGVSASTRSKVLCEGDQTCTIAFNSASALGGNLATGGENVRYFQIGDRGQGFISDCVNGGSTCYGARFNLPTASGGAYLGNVFRGNRIRNHHRNGFSNREHDLNAYFDGMEVSWNTVERAQSPEDSGDGAPHGIYISQRNALVEYNDVSTGQDLLGTQFAIQCFHICDGSIFRFNIARMYAPSRGLITSNGDVARVAGSKVQVYGNVFKAMSGTPSYCGQAYGNGTPIDVYNNVFDGCTNGWDQSANGGAHSTTNIKNNVSTSATAVNCDVTPGVCSSSNNTTSAVAATHFTDAANANYSLKAGSALIDAGADVGLPYNGSTPDRGAYETFVFSSCSVEDGDASKIRVTFTNNAKPPLLPATGITTFTSRLATVSNVVTAAVRTGDNRVDLTVTTPVVFAAAVDISWASGNLTDSSLGGGTINQPYRQTLTNQSCTNNVGAAASHVFTQAAFEFHGLRGTEAAPVGTPYATAPENTNILVRVGGSVRLRIAVTCTTSDCPPTGFYPRYSRNAGGYSTVVPDVFGADNIGFCGTSPDPDIPTSGAASTDQLSTSGTFVAGALVRTSNAIPTIDMALNGKTEMEYCFTFDSDATAGDTYDIRMYQQDGTALNAYTVTPRMTLAAPSAGMGF